MKKLLCAVLAFVIMLSCGAFALTKSELYTAAVDSFMNYLNDDESISLDSLYNNFASLGSYEWSMQYMLYTDILRCIQKGSYARVSTYLTVLRSNADFCAFLEEQSGQSKVGSVDELEAYVNAKKALGQGDSAAALQYFMSCPNFMDSTFQILSIENSFLQEKYEKASSLFEEGLYAEAAALFRELDDYEDSAELSETCAFMISVLAIQEATEEEAPAAEEEKLPEETKPESDETVEPVDDTEYTSGEYKYKKLNNGKIEITKYTGNASELSVPEEIDGFEVYSIGEYAFSYRDPLMEITLPDSVAEMGANPFCGCENLKKIIVSKDHPYLAVLDGVLYDKVNKRLICWPADLTTSSYAVPDGILSIGDYAFSDSKSLTEISLPDSVAEMGANPFRDCDNLKKIIVSKDHPYLAVLDGVLYDKVNKRLICWPADLTASSYAVPDGILSIGDYAFSDSKSLTKVSLPDGLKSIGDYAFYWCGLLTEINFPVGLKSIGDLAFYSCSLTEISLPAGLESIGNQAFGFCFSLTEIHIPDSVTEIGVNPFAAVDILSITVSAENSRFAVVDGVLFDKLNKNLICYPGGLTEATYTVPEGILSIGEHAFDPCKSLKEIILPKGLKSVGRYAFLNSNRFLTVTMPAEITFIGEKIFFSTGHSAGCLLVYTGSYAAQYAKDNGLRYDYIDALDWLNN